MERGPKQYSRTSRAAGTETIPRAAVYCLTTTAASMGPPWEVAAQVSSDSETARSLNFHRDRMGSGQSRFWPSSAIWRGCVTPPKERGRTRLMDLSSTPAEICMGPLERDRQTSRRLTLGTAPFSNLGRLQGGRNPGRTTSKAAPWTVLLQKEVLL